MSRYIKYFENGGRKMSFEIKNDDVLNKYNEIWKKVKKTLNIKFHLFIYLFIYLSIYLSIYLFIYLFIYT